MTKYLFFLLFILFSVSTYSQTCNRMADSLALVDLYNANGGANWIDPWDLAMPLDSWNGVRLTVNGCVRQLFLKGLQGSLHDLNLPDLKELSISSSILLIDSIPDFTHIPQLKVLRLGTSGFTGRIPDFSNLPNLEELNIELMNSLGGSIPDFTNLPMLQQLKLIFIRNITGVIPDFSHLPQINRIFLSNLDSLGGSIPDFSFIPTLATLGISNTNVSGDIPNFSNLPLLKGIVLNNNIGLNDTIPNFLNTPQISTIIFSSNRLIGSIPNFNLPNLTHLQLNGNQLSGSLPDFSMVPSLQVFKADLNQLTGTLPVYQLLPKLTELNLGGNQLAGPIHDFSYNPLLEYLQLGGNQFTGYLPEFSQLSLLEDLLLAGNKFIGPVPDFSNNLNLEELSLNDNRLTSAPTFLHLTKMDYLFLRSNRLTFDDLVPNVGVPSIGYSYRPQEIIGSDTILIKNESEFYNIHIPIDSFLTTNTYTWFKDSSVVAITDSNTFTIPYLIPADSGRYWCEITNSVITDLTLTTAQTYLKVESNLCDSLGESFRVSYSMDSLTLSFEVDTQATDISFTWDFGDGVQVEGRLATHTFSDYGTYEVCLMRDAFCGNDTLCQELTLNNPSTTGIGAFSHLDIQLFPNPTHSLLKVSLPESLPPISGGWEVSIIEMQGKTVKVRQKITSDEIELSVSHLAPGIYYCQISSSTFRTWKKWVKRP